MRSLESPALHGSQALARRRFTHGARFPARGRRWILPRPSIPWRSSKRLRKTRNRLRRPARTTFFIAETKNRSLTPTGSVKSTQVKEYEVYFIGPWEIERLLSKDGKPITEGERKKQDEEVRKQEAKARAGMAKRESGEDPGKNVITLAKFLAADRFYNLHRDTYQGREVYAMDFAPRPDFEPHSVVDKVLKALGGTLWIDEQAKQGVRLEARFLEGVKVGGGLLGSVQKGGNVVLEQRFVNDEIWMPSYAEVHLDAHVFFIHKSINGIVDVQRLSQVPCGFEDYRCREIAVGGGVADGSKRANLPLMRSDPPRPVLALVLAPLCPELSFDPRILCQKARSILVNPRANDAPPRTNVAFWG